MSLLVLGLCGASPFRSVVGQNDSRMLGRLRQVFHKETWQETLKRLTKELVPVGGEADTLQGEMGVVHCKFG